SFAPLPAFLCALCVYAFGLRSRNLPGTLILPPCFPLRPCLLFFAPFASTLFGFRWLLLRLHRAPATSFRPVFLCALACFSLRPLRLRFLVFVASSLGSIYKHAPPS